MEFNHRPWGKIDVVIEHYKEKDKVDIKYVCSTEITVDDRLCDIYYRAKPHPKFGNRYFGLYYLHDADGLSSTVYIINADKVEDLTFGMIEHEGILHYSNCRHDYITVGNTFLDGGRAYIRSGLNYVRLFKVKDGEFIECED